MFSAMFGDVSVFYTHCSGTSIYHNYMNTEDFTLEFEFEITIWPPNTMKIFGLKEVKILFIQNLYSLLRPKRDFLFKF